MLREGQDVDAPAVPADAMSGAPLAAWAHDPTGRYWWRYWDGGSWSAWASNGDEQVWDPVASGPEEAEQLHLGYLRAYLEGAAARRVVGAKAAAALDADVAAWQQVPVLHPPATIDLRPPPPASEAVSAAGPEPVQPEPAEAVPARSDWVPPAAPSPTTAPATPADGIAPELAPSPARETVRVRAGTWVRRSWHAASAELALHGLADLGALLVFAGLFGFVAFAFGEVRPGLRPVAEVLIPATAFGVGAFLHRRGTRVVGDVLVVLGGSLLTVVLVASFSDDAAPPPDLTGTALVVALAGSLLAVAVVESLVVHRLPDSALRFVVAPTCWLAVAAAGLGLGREVPTGSDLATPGPLQWSLVVVAVAATVLASQQLLGGRWARTVGASAWPSLLVAYALTVLAAQREGWPPWPVLMTGIGTVVAVELLAGRGNRVVVALAELTVVAVTASALLQTWEPGRVAAGLAVVLLGLTEVAQRRHAPSRLVVGGLVAAGAALLAAAGEASAVPIELAVASGIGWTWAATQTRWPTTLDRNWSRLLVWVLLVPFVAGVFEASSAPVATLVVAVVVAGVTIALRAMEDDRRSPWSEWVPGVGAAVSVAVLAQLGASTWATVSAAAVVAVACGTAPLRKEVRAGSAALAAVAAVAAGIDLLGWSVPDVAPLVVAVAGGVVLATSVVLRWRSVDRLVWSGVTAVGAMAQLVAAAEWFGSNDWYPSGLWVVAGVSATAIGLGLSAAPSRWPWPRHAAALTGAAAALLLVPTFDVRPAVVVAAAAGLAVVAAAARFVVRRGTAQEVWRQPLTEVTVLGALVAYTASVDAGPGWSALALTAAAVASALHSVGARAFWRIVFQAITVLTAAGAWAFLGDWQQWQAETWVVSGAVLGAVLLVVPVVLAWLPGATNDWAVAAGGAGLLFLLGATVGNFSETVDRGVAGPWVAGGLAVASACAVALVRPTRWAGWRTVAAVFGVGAAAVLLDAVGAGAVELLAASVVVGLAGTAGVVAVTMAERGRGWAPPLEGVALAGLAGAAAAGTQVGRRGVALFLLLLGTELLAAGTVRRRPVLLYLAPVTLCASWLVVASDVFDRGPTWFTVPAGATVLATVELARRQRRSAGLAPSNRPLVLAEVVGMALLVVTPLLQIVQLGLVHVVGSVALGAALIVWGVLTRVRRRLVAGVATTCAALGLLVVVPMVDIARRASGPLVWLLVAGAGLVAIMVAAVFERRGDGAADRQHRVRAAVEGWE